MLDLRAPREGEGNLDSHAGSELEHPIDRRGYGIRLDVTIALRAVRPSDTRPEQAHIVVDLRRCTDSRPAGFGRVLLLDRDGRGDSLYGVDIRLLHPLEELFGVRRQRLDVAALSLREECVEGEGTLPRA